MSPTGRPLVPSSSCKSFVSPAPAVTAVIALDCGFLGPSPPLDPELHGAASGLQQCVLKIRWSGGAGRFPPSGWVALRVLADDSADDSAVLSLQTPPDPICPPLQMWRRSRRPW